MRSLSASMSLLTFQRGRTADRRRGLAIDLWAGLGRLAAPQGLEHALDRGLIEVLVEIVVDLDHRSVHAAAEALDLLDAERDAVGRGLAGLHDGLRAAQPARRRGANLQQIPTPRLELEHRVEGRDLVDADRRHIEQARHLLHRRSRQPALLALRDVEHADYRARLASLR